MECVKKDGLYLEIIATDGDIEQAKAIREARDALYGNHFEVKDTDIRWGGDLAEILLDQYLTECGISHQWHREEAAANQPDFTINGITMDLKTLKRAQPMTERHRHYTFGVTENQYRMDVDTYGFVNFVPELRLFQFIGCIKKRRFIEQATTVKSGQKVHHSYRIRRGHQLGNIEVFKLTPFMEGVMKIAAFNHNRVKQSS